MYKVPCVYFVTHWFCCLERCLKTERAVEIIFWRLDQIQNDQMRRDPILLFCHICKTFCNAFVYLVKKAIPICHLPSDSTKPQQQNSTSAFNLTAGSGVGSRAEVGGKHYKDDQAGSIVHM